MKRTMGATQRHRTLFCRAPTPVLTRARAQARALMLTPIMAMALACPPAQAQDLRPFGIEDIPAVRKVSDPQVSPDGQWVAYTVRETDLPADRNVTQIWMVSWDGRQQIQMTHGFTSANSPKWSPDGRLLSFLAARGVDAHSQVWAMDRRGGEARVATDAGGDVEQYAWSPDSSRLALVIHRVDGDKQPAHQPLVIDRYQFKNDDEGYVRGKTSRRIQVFEIATRELWRLTRDAGYEESDPAWSPDGSRIAFVSNRDVEWERTGNTDVWVADARPGAEPRRLTNFEGQDEGPLAWSPDGRMIAYAQGRSPQDWQFLRRELAVVPLDGGAAAFPARTLDRDALDPEFSADGRFLEFLTIDSRSVYAARVLVTGGPVQRLSGLTNVISGRSRAARHLAVASSSDEAPGEIHALENGRLRRLTSHNDSWRKRVRLRIAQDVEFRSNDGTLVQGLLVTPQGNREGVRYPTIVWIHGGPYGQDDHEFEIHRQLFAAHGYAVLQVNFRGSAGRGRDYASARTVSQGVQDVADVIAGVDHAIAIGVADPQRLGVGGWSYGGILTNFIVAQDPRFKAAIAGAGSGSVISLYGTDQYVYQYDEAWGAPWKNPQLWLDRSRPLFQADRIRTPTLFIGGLLDFNVPIAGAEQMYQALKSRRVPTQLVIYPEEHHSISRPSLRRDLLQRYLDWYAEYLKE